MHALDVDIAGYAPEAELIVLPARKTADVRPTSFEHATRRMIDARGARTTLARLRVGRHLRLR
jgi:hypothetical protein